MEDRITQLPCCFCGEALNEWLNDTREKQVGLGNYGLMFHNHCIIELATFAPVQVQEATYLWEPYWQKSAVAYHAWLTTLLVPPSCVLCSQPLGKWKRGDVFQRIAYDDFFLPLHSKCIEELARCTPDALKQRIAHCAPEIQEDVGIFHVALEVWSRTNVYPPSITYVL